MRSAIPYVNLAAQFEEEREELLAVVTRVLSDGMLVGGPEVPELESRLAALCGAEHAVALNSGTDALILGLRALDIGPGDEVITPPNSFVASTAAVVAVGARPVFADVLPDQNIDPDAVEAVITPRTRAIMPVHLTGRVCNMDAIMEIARRHGVHVIEDAAQAIGSKYRGRPAGSCRAVGCFSTHPLKNLNAIGDGGFVTTSDAKIADRIRKLRNHGLIDRDTVTEFGFVSRIDTLQAAILLMRLERLPSIIERRRRNARLYQQLLDRSFVFLPDCKDEQFNTFHTFVIQTDRRDELKQYLAEHGIGTAIHYPIPIHLQPAAKPLGHRKGDFPVTERQAERILTLPVNQFMTEDDVRRVAEAVNRFHKKRAAA
ncbi:MAG: DegT/DnrJ/EryC1/StrS family aminotransferase [Rhodospirillaceae bacterium]|nr:DegT/DnrJ/EryC1/StrS family aminotransferase [Rhodospirillaceae bacterium]